MTNFKLTIVCGGPSLERGISLNSARSVLDHLYEIPCQVYYISPTMQVYSIPHDWVYSNTPEDFDYKLNGLDSMSLTQWVQLEHHLVFNVIHGHFGEDGALNALLEANQIRYVGSSSQACQKMFDKMTAAKILQANGYPVLPVKYASIDQCQQMLKQYKKVVIKPSAGGSSLGVGVVHEASQIQQAIDTVVGMNDQPICEAYCNGTEFTVIVLDSKSGPVALVPTEIEIADRDAIFDYRRKYLPTSNTRWHCPARVSDASLALIRNQAESIFKLFGMSDFVRLDGWIDQGEIIFSDINPISGMEQNSFIFLQASRVGLTHRELLRYLIEYSGQRQGVTIPTVQSSTASKTVLPVLMGGCTEERQVSLMSGTNVWLKLMGSDRYQPKPYFVDGCQRIWPLSYSYALNHTTEEVWDHITNVKGIRQKMMGLYQEIRDRLGLENIPIEQLHPDVEGMSIETFCQKYQAKRLIIALHGGFGEDGRLQSYLNQYYIRYNGSGVLGSRLGMDKFLFGERIQALEVEGVQSLPKMKLNQDMDWGDVQSFACPCVIKPRSLGCSVGVTVCSDEHSYQALRTQLGDSEYIVEPYIETDKIKLQAGQLVRTVCRGWLEMTMTMVYDQDWIALDPSITVAQSDFLSIEEKFQGGTGINLTPPPETMVTQGALVRLKRKMTQVAQGIGIRQYARIDLFYHTETEKVIVIEVNTLPALTPSTVLYHQMMSSGFCPSPRAALEWLSNTLAYDINQSKVDT